MAQFSVPPEKSRKPPAGKKVVHGLQVGVPGNLQALIGTCVQQGFTVKSDIHFLRKGGDFHGSVVCTTLESYSARKRNAYGC